MSSLKAAFINELYKISKKKKIFVAAILCLAVIIAGAVISCIANNFLGINITGRGEFSVMMLPVFVSVIIPLFTTFICIEMFCGEFANNTIKTTLLSPATRLTIFTAKIGAMAVFILAMLVFSMLVSFAAAVIIRHTEYNIPKILATYLISFLPLLVFGLMTAMVANMAKGGGIAFMICILVYLVFKVLELLNPMYASLFFTSEMSMYVLLNAPLISIAKLLRLTAILIGYIIALFSYGYLMFERKSI